MPEPTADAADFETAEDGLADGPWALRIYVYGSGFVPRSAFFQASVGAVPVEGIFLYPDGSGFSGLLAQAPPAGAVLSFGYDELVPSGVLYNPPVA